MIRAARKASLKNLSNWLIPVVTESTDKKYRHCRLEEQLDHRSASIQELQILVHEAHEDFRRHFRKLLGESLDPLGGADSEYPLEDYPRIFPLQQLKGYFGEIFAGVIAENLDPLGHQWEVPIFAFRHHHSAFHQFEMYRQNGEPPKTRPGRFGDDMLAFERDSEGNIIRALVCEAKCTSKHNTEMIKDAHEKASEGNFVPVDYLKLVELLKDYPTDPNAVAWIHALQRLQFVRRNTINYERCDLVSYICGLPPARAELISRSKPHIKYTANRRLEAVEVLLHDVEGLVEAVYQKEEIAIISIKSPALLDELWQDIVRCVTPQKVKELVSQHCRLLSFDGYRAIVEVSSLGVYRDVLSKDTHIRQAFEETGAVVLNGGQMKVELKLKVRDTTARKDLQIEPILSGNVTGDKEIDIIQWEKNEKLESLQ
ncbi:hypothetical protein [Leptolyngbya sp. GGD]|uniref:hypothetical protein n=1 Tax=Leptolyngbya sp. GGD TaxID=2997907 RepID=UPI00227BEFC4|nr:hypothetical protein [Leptolyngbya sp. GGD]MCY6494534.1 hypothetical protein [Leptolyngbya sp. GGD]